MAMLKRLVCLANSRKLSGRCIAGKAKTEDGPWSYVRPVSNWISHLGGLVGATVTVTLEVEAKIPGGASDHVVRTVTENSRTLKFTSQGFEEE